MTRDRDFVVERCQQLLGAKAVTAFQPGSPAYEALIAERDKLRAEIERLTDWGGEKVVEICELRAEIEHLRTTLGYLADNIDNPALVAVAEAALKPKP